ncbi:MarR family winged helix-turn-helix transcriptional regulator [Tepidibacter formicigenes]|uniref:MarR family transcriptional regulator, 2-MHQ and catechol-resistance regulon repressor n=1 Tax=Tepidibacter formicigenes DSM 15518 TaxID=1123349 RepID=A0A1M6MP05_9FIRM|nr:MarR family transcriptional regulator [Tepidibacter formicigenes]SHJ85211.1 MarR family transcriptional regulator, 2-MHQ and catechol-resistance regulon repressor [Tepidibacter formicigenes DSM 15518]
MNKKELYDFLESYNFIEDMSGKTIINLMKSVEIMRFVYNNLFAKHGISEPKFYVLLLLSYSEDGMVLSEIGEKMLVTRANMTGLMDRMEKEGLVEKRVNPKDRRSTKAYLTDKGRELFEDIKAIHIDFSKQMTRVLDIKEKENLNNLLEKLQCDIVNCFSEEE